jgi:hypothetical protein
MNTRERMDHIHSGPAELKLDEPLRFRRRARSNPCDFNDFLEALRSSETIRTVECGSHRELGISEDEWVLLVKTLGSIKGIEDLELHCISGSRDFHSFQAVANALNNAQSLRKLEIYIESETFPGDSQGLAALANALREHTVLQEFACIDFSHVQLQAAQNTALNSLLQALSACLHLRKVTIMTANGSADAMKTLLHLHKATELHLVLATELQLVLETEHWLAVADEIRQGRCNVQTLTLTMLQDMRSETTEAVKAVASAIQLDCNLEDLTLEIKNGFTDEEGLALAEALTVNTTLRMIKLAVYFPYNEVRNEATLGAPAYKAFAAMLRVNTNLVLELPEFEFAGADERLLESRKQMHIEQRLNKVGRGKLLASKQTTKEEWVDALHELSSDDVDDEPEDVDDEPEALRISCLFSLLRLNPSVVCMP